MAGNIQETIFRAVDIITEKKIGEVQFDKTIEAIVTNDARADEGEYEVKYQDILMTVFSNNNTIKYKKDQNVYVLVPQGDMGNKKVIVGKKESKGEEFLDIADMIDKIDKLGGNYVNEPEGKVFSFDSGVNQITKVSMRDEDFINDYKNKLNLLIGANIVTDLLNEDGDYGIELDLTYTDGTRHSYRVSLVSMTGNPYKLAGQYQYKVFSLYLADVETVNGLYVYTKGFVETRKDAIKFSNVEVVFTKPREVDGLTQFTGEIVTPKGDTFKNGIVNAKDELYLEMNLFKVGKPLSPNAVYKWFFMDSGITSNQNPGWDVDGGLGWRIIDSKVEGFGSIIKISEDGRVLTITPNFIPNLEVFKCVAIFGGESIELPDGSSKNLDSVKVEATQTIVDQTDAINITINSSMGDVFKENGNVTSTILSAAVTFGSDIISPSKFLYSWSRIQEDGTVVPLSNLQDSEKLTVDVKNDILDIGNYICEVYLK